MLGNDIVDLGDPETQHGARHPRFDARVFAPAEREKLRASGTGLLRASGTGLLRASDTGRLRASDADRLRWMLWAAKEAAYKAARRQRPDTVFSPARFEVALDSIERGRVTHDGRIYPVRFHADAGCIHAVAFEPDSDNGEQPHIVGSRRLDESERADASRKVREFAIDAIAARLDVPKSELRIERAGRLPQLTLRDVPISAVLSLSHHGAYVGFACRLGGAAGAAS